MKPTMSALPLHVRDNADVVRVAAAVVVLALCGAGCGIDDDPLRVPGSTLQSTVVDENGDAAVEQGPGEPLVDRTELAPRGAATREVVRFGQLTDTHVRDEESPARVPFLDRLGPPVSSAFRPQEAMSPHVLNAAIRAVNTQRPDAVLLTGDLVDNAQVNELDQFLDVVQGGDVVPDSGDDGYDGVQAQSNPDGFFYRPDVDAPRLVGLLRRAALPFFAPGLRAPWYPAVGNHDVLVQGQQPPSEAIDAIATGGRALLTYDPSSPTSCARRSRPARRPATAPTCAASRRMRSSSCWRTASPATTRPTCRPTRAGACSKATSWSSAGPRRRRPRRGDDWPAGLRRRPRPGGAGDRPGHRRADGRRRGRAEAGPDRVSRARARPSRRPRRRRRRPPRAGPQRGWRPRARPARRRPARHRGDHRRPPPQRGAAGPDAPAATGASPPRRWPTGPSRGGCSGSSPGRAGNARSRPGWSTTRAAWTAGTSPARPASSPISTPRAVDRRGGRGGAATATSGSGCRRGAMAAASRRCPGASPRGRDRAGRGA